MFRDTLIGMMRSSEGMTEKEAIVSNCEKLRAKVDPDNQYPTLCCYGPGSGEELLLEYDFVPAWQGVVTTAEEALNAALESFMQSSSDKTDGEKTT